MSVPSWFEDPELWNMVIIADVVFRETDVQVTGSPITNKWDIQKSGTADGAPSKDQGYQPWQPSLQVSIWNQELYEAYVDLLRIAQPRPGKTGSKPIIVVSHPRFQIHGIEKFRLEKLHPLKKVDSYREMMQVDLLQYFPEPKPIPPPATPAEPQPNYGRRGELGLELEQFKPSKTTVKP